MQISKRKRSTTTSRILQELILARAETRYWYGTRLPQGFVSTGHLCKPDIGGSEAIRRVREIRERGIDIQKQHFESVNRLDEKVHCWIYRLETDPGLIDVKKGCLKDLPKAG